MSAVLRWRCDICHSEAEVVEEVPRGMLEFFYPAQPPGWTGRLDNKVKLDLCSQACVVAHQQRVLAREQAKLAVDAT